MTEQTPVPELDALDVVFGSIDHLPLRKNLPEEFRERWHHRSGYCGAASGLFFNGGTFASHGLTPKDGIDQCAAESAVLAALRSFEPSHERKIGGVGYLLSQWFDLSKAA